MVPLRSSQSRNPAGEPISAQKRHVNETWLPYVIALAGSLSATAVRDALGSILGEKGPILPFFIVVAVSAWRGGLGPGLLATGLSVALADWFFVLPLHSFRLPNLAEQIRMGLFVLEGVAISLLGESALRVVRSARKQAAALGESKARYRLLADHSDDFVSLSDREGNLLYLSPSFSRVTGWTTDEVMQSDWRTGMHPEELPMLEQARAANLRGEATTLEHRVRCKDGRWLWTEARCKPISGPDERVEQMVIWSRDITKRRQAESALREIEDRLNTVVENLDEGLVICDSAGRLLQWNRASFEMHGFSKVENRDFRLAEMPELFELSTLEGKPIELEQWPMSRVLRGEVLSNFEVRVRRRDSGTERLFSYGGASVRDNSGRPLAFVTMVEITERKRLQREILDVSEREQCRLGQDLHDGLGQELAGIAFLCQVIANNLEAEAHPCAKSARDITAYISGTIDSARRLAKGLYPIELNRYGLLFALEELANQTSQRFGIGCELRKDGSEPKWGKTAEIHLYRIVQECIGNAIKHGKASRIVIESAAGESFHAYTVSDDGLGFEKKLPNTGMGLHLMNYRAEVIGAKIDVRKPEGGGCLVTCRIPV